MKLSFTKMQGAGNDFIVLDSYTRDLSLFMTVMQIRTLADRHFGIGADQIILIEKPTVDGADFKYRIFNCNGHEVEHCGNGARCLMKFVRDNRLTDKRTVYIEMKNDVISITMFENDEIIVNMGTPIFNPIQVPFDTRYTEIQNSDGIKLNTKFSIPSPFGRQSNGCDMLWPININGKTRWISVVSMGNPHAVQIVDNVDVYPVIEEGSCIENHLCFPNSVNAGFMQIISRHEVKLRVYERGVGETRSCGTGACAAVAAGIRLGQIDSPVTVHTHGGTLKIIWNGIQDSFAQMELLGPAVTVFKGEIDIDIYKHHSPSSTLPINK
ncbi:MAG: diaminopimelate epimerase [Burkholderia sp.]|nr:diaminopimelate epimerase [Burkholderia sp.]